jgi:RNA polymerase sigma factor (sigma-70 family)
MPKPTTDKTEELLYASVKGNRQSQELLYKQYYGFAMSVCLRYVQNKEEALEIVNDSFMKIFIKGEGYNSSFPFKAWFKRIIVNTALDFYRNNKKFYFHENLENAYETASTESSVLAQLNYEELLGFVQKLPPSYKMVFNLYVIDGFSHEEISQKLNISVGTSKSNLSRAREILRQMLTKTEKIIIKSINF